MAYTVPKLTDYSAAALEKARADAPSAREQETREILLAPRKPSIPHDLEWKQRWQEWKTFRDRWIARKNGITTQINDLWLKGAPREAKREAGQVVNNLKKKIEDEIARSEATLERFKLGDERGIIESAERFPTMDDALRA